MAKVYSRFRRWKVLDRILRWYLLRRCPNLSRVPCYDLSPRVQNVKNTRSKKSWANKEVCLTFRSSLMWARQNWWNIGRRKKAAETRNDFQVNQLFPIILFSVTKNEFFSDDSTFFPCSKSSAINFFCSPMLSRVLPRRERRIESGNFWRNSNFHIEHYLSCHLVRRFISLKIKLWKSLKLQIDFGKRTLLVARTPRIFRKKWGANYRERVQFQLCSQIGTGEKVTLYISTDQINPPAIA